MYHAELTHKHVKASRFEVNITPLERMGRVFIGLVGLLAGIVLLASTAGLLATVLEILLILAGIDMIVSGTTGYCPLYKKLGRPSLKEAEACHEHHS